MSKGLDFSALENGLESFNDRFVKGVRMFAEADSAPKLQNYAKDNAKWTDRTGHARQRLTCTVSRIEIGFRLMLSHGVDYGINLEKDYEEKYAIINPTIKEAGSKDVIPAFENFMQKLGGK